MRDFGQPTTKLTVRALRGTGAPSDAWELGPVELRVVGSLGEGESSRVLLVEDREGKKRALKIAAPGMNEVLLHEARVLSCAGGRGLPRLLSTALSDAGEVALVVEYFEGQSLREGKGELSGQAAFVELSEALVALHELGFFHGDVKPENIIVAGGHALLIDAGLAQESTRDARAVGFTPKYAAPELVARGVIGPLTDAYALATSISEIFPDLASALEPFCEAEEARRVPLKAALGPELILRIGLLRARFAALSRAALLGAETGSVELGGSFGFVQGQLVDVFEQLLGLCFVRQALSGEPSGSPRSAELETSLREALGPLTGSDRSRWLGFVSGPHALSFRFRGSDEELFARLIEVFQKKPRAALTQSDLSGAPEDHGCLSNTELAFRLGESGAEFALVLELEKRANLPLFLLLQGARLARRQGDYQLAHRLLDRACDVVGPELGSGLEIGLERAATLRRQGRLEEGLGLLPEPQQVRELGLNAGLAAPILAVWARHAYDNGDLERAERILQGSPAGPSTAEVLGLVEIARGRPLRALELVDEFRNDKWGAEEEARLAAVAAMAHQLLGATSEACDEFRRAVEGAVRSGSVLEEATYLTGLAAVATDAMRFEVALASAARAAALFEVLGRPAHAARALLSQAAVLSALGSEGELEAVVFRALPMAIEHGDRRCAGYLELCLVDGLGDRAARLAALERASLHLEDPDDRLRIDARRLELTGTIADGADQRAMQTEVRGAKLDWWKARALHAAKTGQGDAQEIIAQVVQLSGRGSELSEGPATIAAAALALSAGQVEAARRLTARAAMLAETFQSQVPDEYRERTRRLPWVETALKDRFQSFSGAQLADVESLLRALSHRDGLRPLFRQVLDLLLLWTGVERGLLLLRAPGDRLSFRVGRNLRRRDLSPEQRSLSETLARRALSEGRPIFVVDGMSEFVDVHQSVHALRLRSVLALPLVAGGETFGVAYLDDRYQRGAFGEPEVAWASLIGTIAALAIRDARDRLLLKRATLREERAKKRLERTLEGKEAEVELLERKLRDETQSLGPQSEFGLVYESRSMHRLVSGLRKIAHSEVPILITGESGTGKEMVARAIAQAGPRASRPFVAENCAALPESLLESELFGHTRGAFTGAIRDRVGLFELADGGTLFLDEVGEMPLSMQAKLLRVLQDGMVRRVGSEKGRRVDVRLVTATHRSLSELVRAGRFREDLFYRLNVIPLAIPPLRERKEDILPLVRHFIARYAKDRVIKIAPGAARALLDYDWPGNVRQLENEVRRLLVFVEREITAADLALSASSSGAEDKQLGLRERVDALEKSLVLAALDEHGGNRTKVAEALGLSRQGLLKMMRRLGIAQE